MDPNETLKQLRHAAKCFKCQDDMQELFEALDEWLSKGGFLPDDWSNRE